MTHTGHTRREFIRRAGLAGVVSALGATGLRALNASETSRRSTGGVASLDSNAFTICIRPKPYEKAFANPLKGFRTDLPSDGGDGRGLDNPLITLARHYIRWNEIENAETDSVDRVLEFCNAKWKGVEKRNQKIIPRVYLYWPEKYYWQANLRAGDYGSSRFLRRLEKFISKLGEAWDNDPRVAYIETGIVGPCGEQWGPTPHFELRKVIGDGYAAAFRNKLCMVRYPWQWKDYSFGVFWDSWGTRKDTARMLEALDSVELRDSWKTRVRGGEISYGFGEPPGKDPDDTMTNDHHADWIECLTRRGHWNHLGWVSYYDWKRSATGPIAQRLQKTFGYRFVLDEVRYPAKLSGGQSMKMSLKVRNIGSSPFYYNWPIAAFLLDEQTREVRWRGLFEGADIRLWLPGERWQQFADWDPTLSCFVLNHEPARYEVTPQSYEVTGNFVLPGELNRQRYVLAVAILDPAGMAPGCRFACDQYWRSGYHPIGRVAVGTELGKAELDSGTFDDLANDTTLRYKTV